MLFGLLGLLAAIYLSLLLGAALWAVVERTLSALERRRRPAHAESPSVEPKQDGHATGFGGAAPLPH
jgi:HAMP domain-containing protein